MSSLFGSRPNFGMVQSPYQQTENIYPNLTKLTTAAGNYAGDLMSGILPPDVSENIQNEGAAFGLTSGAGTPSAGSVAGNFTLKDLGLSSLGEQQQGFGDYLQFLTGMGSQMLDPSLLYQEATAKAQPNPNTAGYAKLGTQILGAVGGML